jgi:hypothetical protein
MEINATRSTIHGRWATATALQLGEKGRGVGTGTHVDGWMWKIQVINVIAFGVGPGVAATREMRGAGK